MWYVLGSVVLLVYVIFFALIKASARGNQMAQEIFNNDKTK